MARHTNGSKAPTLLSRIERVMAEADEPLRCLDIARRAAVTEHVTWSELYTLHKTYKAADFVMEDGRRHWYLTPATDTRCRRVMERVPEEPGSRNGAMPGVAGRSKQSRLAAEANLIAEQLRARRTT